MTPTFIIPIALTLFIVLLLIPRCTMRFHRRNKGGSWYLYRAHDDGRTFWMQFPLDTEGNEPKFELIKEEHYGERIKRG